MVKLEIIQGGNQIENKAKAAISALMRGDLELFNEIFKTIPEPPTFSSAPCGSDSLPKIAKAKSV